MGQLKLIGWAREDQITAAAGLLNKAADVLDSRGWIQGRVQDDQGNVCAIGALCVAGLDEVPQTVAFDSVEIIAQGVFYRVTGYNISTFNDEPERTKAEVQAKMRYAAAEAVKEVQTWKAKQELEKSPESSPSCED